MEIRFWHSRLTRAVSSINQSPIVSTLVIDLRVLDIRTGLTRSIHANEWRIASWLVATLEKYICYDAKFGAITRELSIVTLGFVR